MYRSMCLILKPADKNKTSLLRLLNESVIHLLLGKTRKRILERLVDIFGSVFHPLNKTNKTHWQFTRTS